DFMNHPARCDEPRARAAREVPGQRPVFLADLPRALPLAGHPGTSRAAQAAERTTAMVIPVYRPTDWIDAAVHSAKSPLRIVTSWPSRAQVPPAAPSRPTRQPAPTPPPAASPPPPADTPALSAPNTSPTSTLGACDHVRPPVSRA